MKISLPLISILLSLFCQKAVAKTLPLFENDSLLKVYLTKSNLGLDSGADAVVLYEKGAAKLAIKDYPGQPKSSPHYITVSYTVERYIKINKQQALDVADIVVPYTKELGLDDLDFQTINLNNGIVDRQKIKKKDMLKEKLSKEAKIYKLSFPNIKPGSIVYYTYTYNIRLDRVAAGQFFPLNWAFQSPYPTLESRFELTIPDLIDYRAIPKNVGFTRINSEAELGTQDNVEFFNISERLSKEGQKNIVWLRRNIMPEPANDDFILNPDIMTEKLTIYISIRFQAPWIKSTKRIPREWAYANNEYFYAHLFLGKWVFRPHDSLSFTLNKLIAGKSDDLSIAKTIFKFTRDSVECTGPSDVTKVWSTISPLSTLKEKKGTTTDINILLTSLCRKAGLKSFPVLLSTTDNDKINENYFEPGALNYLVSLVSIGNRYYLLDASSKHLPFGILKPKCYNGFAWLVNEKGIPITISPDSLFEKTIFTATAKPAAQPGWYSFKLEQKLGNVDGPAIRAMWKQDSVAVKKELEETIHKLEYKMALKQLKLHNLDNPDTALVITYDMELQLDTDKDITYLNPFFHKFYDTNPFIETKRTHPVEFGKTFNYSFLLKFQLPDGYQMEEYSDPVSLSLNKGDMQYRNNMQYDAGKKIFTLSSTLNSKTATIAPEDYDALRSFYDRVIAEQNKKIVIRKTKSQQ